jgi:hypothetical protein
MSQERNSKMCRGKCIFEEVLETVEFSARSGQAELAAEQFSARSGAAGLAAELQFCLKTDPMVHKLSQIRLKTCDYIL